MNTTLASNPRLPKNATCSDTLITAVWQLRRLRRVETQIWTTRMNETRMSKPVKWTLSETYDMNDRLFQRLQSRLNAAERTFRRCLQDLKRLEAERLSSELPEPAPQPRFDPSRDCKGAVPASPQPEQSKHETPKLASIRRPTPQPQPSASETPAPASQSPDASSAKPLDPRPETSK